MASLFLILIVVFIFWLLTRYSGRILSYLLRRQLQRQFNSMFGGQNSRRQSPFGSQQSTANAPKERQRPRKRFGSDVGEYVDFEEITVTETTDSTSYTYTHTTQQSCKNEPRISDAEWEEL